MKTRIIEPALLILVASIFGALSLPGDTDSIALEKKRLLNATIYVITADLSDPTIKVDVGLPEKGISHSENFQTMVNRRAPIAAVTGTFFDTRTLYPTGTIVSDGKVVCKNYIGTAVCFIKPGANPSAYCVEFTDALYGRDYDMSEAQCGLRAGPRLLADGRYALNPSREGFRHSGLFGCRTRVAMGVTAHNKLLLTVVKTPVTFGRLAAIMKMLGAVNAINLDGGTSSAMYYQGRIICRPGRSLTNIVEVRRTQPTYNPIKAAGDFTPGGLLPFSSGEIRLLVKITGPAIDTTEPYEANNNDVALTHGNYSAVISRTELRRAQGRHSVLPVYRTKLPGLKRLDNSQHFINVAANVQVMHYLVA